MTTDPAAMTGGTDLAHRYATILGVELVTLERPLFDVAGDGAPLGVVRPHGRSRAEKLHRRWRGSEKLRGLRMEKSPLTPRIWTRLLRYANNRRPIPRGPRVVAYFDGPHDTYLGSESEVWGWVDGACLLHDITHAAGYWHPSLTVMSTGEEEEEAGMIVYEWLWLCALGLQTNPALLRAYQTLAWADALLYEDVTAMPEYIAEHVHWYQPQMLIAARHAGLPLPPPLFVRG